MPVAESRLEILQARKLIQCVRLKDSAQIAKLVQLGIPGLINYQGEFSGVYVYNERKKNRVKLNCEYRLWYDRI